VSWDNYMRKYGAEEVKKYEEAVNEYNAREYHCPQCDFKLSFVEWLSDRCYACGWSWK
jgi:ribosomal protein L37AE/L43A